MHPQWRCGRVARQRSAKPCTAVRIRSTPLKVKPVLFLERVFFYIFIYKKTMKNSLLPFLLLICSITNAQYTLQKSDVFIVDGKIIDYYGPGGDIIIPEQIDGETITAIGGNLIGHDDAVFSRKQLTSIVIPNTVIEIGYKAFSYNFLTEINLPNSIERIGGYAFEYNSISTISFSENIKRIENNCFSHNNLSSITIPEYITDNVWGDNIFFDNDFTSFIVPDHMKEIPNGFLSGNLLTELDLHSDLRSIGDHAFSNNFLESITVPESLLGFGEGAFQSNLLKTLTLPESLLYISSRAFADNEIAGEIVFPKNIRGINYASFENNLIEKVVFLYDGDDSFSIGRLAFRNNQLTEVIFPNSYSYLFVGQRAFQNNLLTNLTFGSVDQIEDFAFKDNLLEYVVFKSDYGPWQPIINETFISNNMKAVYSQFPSHIYRPGSLGGTYTKYYEDTAFFNSLSEDIWFDAEVDNVDYTIETDGLVFTIQQVYTPEYVSGDYLPGGYLRVQVGANCTITPYKEGVTFYPSNYSIEDIQQHSDLGVFFRTSPEDVLALSDLDKSEITSSVYPNPSNGEFTLDLGNNETPISINVFDANARFIKALPNKVKQKVKLLDIERGVYLLNIETKTDTKQIKVLITE